MNKDKFSYLIYKAFNIIFLYNVLGTSYGIIFGLFTLALQDLIASYFPPFGLIKWYGFIVFGVLLFNFKPIFKKKYLDPNIEKRLVYIRQIMEEGKFTVEEKRSIWRSLANSIISEHLQESENTNNKHHSHNLNTG